jgi:hypothetical protein
MMNMRLSAITKLATVGSLLNLAMSCANPTNKIISPPPKSSAKPASRARRSASNSRFCNSTVSRPKSSARRAKPTAARAMAISPKSPGFNTRAAYNNAAQLTICWIQRSAAVQAMPVTSERSSAWLPVTVSASRFDRSILAFIAPREANA